MLTEKKQVLITVKAYPNPSKKYKETVCCAGIDLSTKRWIRLYPIPFRYLHYQKQFKKYSIIEVLVTKAVDDKRPESFKVDVDSIKVLNFLDTKNNWEERAKRVLPTLSSSFCDVLNESISSDKSLGAFRPTDIDFLFKKKSLEDKEKRGEHLAQQSLFAKVKDVVDEIPYDFYYIFKCKDTLNCPGHKLPIIDWEIGEAYRDWQKRYPDTKELLEKIKERWLIRMCAEKNDIVFYVGNQLRFRKNFMILGTFYPPKKA